MKREFQLSSRRAFLEQTAGAMTILSTIASQRAQAGEKTTSNPFAYDVSRLEKTDPSLITYEETLRWRAPHASPKRIAVGPDDQLYVCSGQYVTAMDHTGRPGLEIALSEVTRCVVVAKNGTVFIGLRDHLEVFDARGQRQAKWDPAGRKSWFTGLALTENEVFVADAGGRVILRYDQSGKLIRRIGERDKERNVPGFIIPSPFFDVKMARDGLLRVNNPGRHRVETYTCDGDFEGAWGKVSMGIAGFCGCCNPVHLALLPDGRFVTCEKGLPRVKIYSESGEFESVVAGVEAFAANAKACGPSDCTSGGLDAAVDSQGRIYVLDLVAGDIRVMKRKT